MLGQFVTGYFGVQSEKSFKDINPLTQVNHYDSRTTQDKNQYAENPLHLKALDLFEVSSIAGFKCCNFCVDIHTLFRKLLAKELESHQ